MITFGKSYVAVFIFWVQSETKFAYESNVVEVDISLVDNQLVGQSDTLTSGKTCISLDTTPVQ